MLSFKYDGCTAKCDRDGCGNVAEVGGASVADFLRQNPQAAVEALRYIGWQSDSKDLCPDCASVPMEVGRR